ncbi:MAG TPA: hypothetical protein VNZ52_09635 [Candidatus Thermoplasmatota archaeon]|nr:hypothetical protein [Candidatus Thermoplasmatota archaeon]
MPDHWTDWDRARREGRPPEAFLEALSDEALTGMLATGAARAPEERELVARILLDRMKALRGDPARDTPRPKDPRALTERFRWMEAQVHRTEDVAERHEVAPDRVPPREVTRAAHAASSAVRETRGDLEEALRESEES